jgi:hypothetical protein
MLAIADAIAVQPSLGKLLEPLADSAQQRAYSIALPKIN